VQSAAGLVRGFHEHRMTARAAVNRTKRPVEEYLQTDATVLTPARPSSNPVLARRDQEQCDLAKVIGRSDDLGAMVSCALHVVPEGPQTAGQF